MDKFAIRLNEFSSIHECVTPETIPLMFESYTYFYEKYGFKHQWFMPINVDGYTDKLVEEYKNQMKMIFDYLISINDISAIQSMPPFSKKESQCNDYSKPCGAGCNFITFSPSGEIFPCHEFYFNDREKESKIGDIERGINNKRRKIFVEYDISDMSCMNSKDCVVSKYCYTCIANNFTRTKNMFANKIPFKCLFTKADKEVAVYVTEKIDIIGKQNGLNKR